MQPHRILLAALVASVLYASPSTVDGLPAEEGSSAAAAAAESPQQQQTTSTTTALPPAAIVVEGVREGRKYYDKPAVNGLKKSGDAAAAPPSPSILSVVSPNAILQQLDWKTLISTAMKMFFGGNDEQSKQASRQMVDMIVGLIDGLRLSFTMRKAQARSNGHEMSPTADAALAGLSMLKAYVKTIVSQDEQCVKKYLCQANREAVRDGNKVGYVIAQFGSYATSYMLENLQTTPFDENFNAGKEGRNGANCEEIFQQCNELH